jgi:phospholipase/carboxylesterase
MRNRLDCSSLDLSTRLEKLYSTLTSPAENPRPTSLGSSISLFGPERYEPRYDYPLIVWLHSCNSNEQELSQLMPNLSMQNYVACAPRGTRATDPCGKQFQWGTSAASVAVAEESVFEAVDAATSQFSIARDKIFIAGFGGGASMAWRIGLRYPDYFAGVVNVCGQFPTQNQPLAKLGLARHIPTLWMYGEESVRSGVDHICETLPVLHSARLSVHMRQYPCGDELLTNMLSDMNSWLMERVTNQPARFEEIREESFSRN